MVHINKKTSELATCGGGATVKLWIPCYANFEMVYVTAARMYCRGREPSLYTNLCTAAQWCN